MGKLVNREILFGLYDDEEFLLDAVHTANGEHLEITDVYTPFPVHGLDPLLGLSESRLHVAGFIYGMTGTLIAFSFMTWVFTSNWPIIFGGKPYWSVPAFIPITFEFTVLMAAVGMVFTFYIICGLGPGVTNPYLHPRITDDKFCISFDITDKTTEEIAELRAFFNKTGADIHTKEIQLPIKKVVTGAH
jgi:hypothetical protein